MSERKDSVVEIVHNERERSTFHHNKNVVEQIQAMYESGESVLKITQLFGVSSNYVHVSAKRKGWKRPSWYKWKFKPVKADVFAESKAVKSSAARKNKKNVSYDTYLASLALFDKHLEQIDQQKTRIAALETMCSSFNRLAMVQEVFEQLNAEDKSSFYDEAFSSMRTENMALKEINETIAKENNTLKEQVKLLNERLKESLQKEEMLSDKLSEAIAERDAKSDELEELKKQGAS